MRRGATWLPVLLAASFPLAAIGWTKSHLAVPAHRALPHAVAQPGRAQLQFPALFTPEVRYWTQEIQRWSVEYRLAVELIATVMQIESCGHPAIESSAGALGLFQVMPYHFASDERALAPEVNARRGLSYLARSLELAGGDRRLALAGYNGGHGVIGRTSASWPDETLRYADWGTRILLDAHNGLQSSPALEDWLQAGGRSLCQRAADYLGLN